MSLSRSPMPHILAVDDEANILRIAQVILQRGGFRVSTARDGVDALEKINAERPDLILMDVMMPRMDGFATLERLKADPLTAAIPVVMITAQAKDADHFAAEERGAAGYLNKPFNPNDLVETVKRVLNGEI